MMKSREKRVIANAGELEALTQAYTVLDNLHDKTTDRIIECKRQIEELTETLEFEKDELENIEAVMVEVEKKIDKLESD